MLLAVGGYVYSKVHETFYPLFSDSLSSKKAGNHNGVRYGFLLIAFIFLFPVVRVFSDNYSSICNSE